MSPRIRILVLFLAALGAGPGLSARAQAYGGAPDLPDRPATRRIGTNLRAFGIPFTVQDPNDRYVEVQLYMSRDRGQTWNFHSRQPVRAAEFPFESRGDGEYWFAIRTLDRDRQLHPPGAMTPELKVVVDTVQPRLDFRIQTDASGRIVCRWTAEDEHLDPARTRLAFRPLIDTSDSRNQWLTVPYKPVGSPVDRVFTDQYAWWPEPRSPEVLVQLVVADIAGNEAVEERQIVLPDSRMAPGQPGIVTHGTQKPTLDFDQLPWNQARPGSALFEVSSTARSPDPPGMETVARPEVSAPSGGPPASVPLMYGAVAASPDPLALPGGVDAPTIAWPSQVAGGSGRSPSVTTARPVFEDQRPVLTGEQSPPARLASDSSGPAPGLALPPVAPGPGGQSVLSGWPPQTGEALETGGPTGISSVQPPMLAASAPWNAATPPAIPSMSDGAPATVRFVNSRRFRLDYSFDALTPEVIAKVVLWVTADQGQTWTAWAEDTDNQSPFPVEMHEPGLYGYRIVFHTVDGVAGRAPARGDDADVWIAIDLDPPLARLTGAPYGRGLNAGALLIQWEASDAMLRNNPVRLSWGTGRDGPWTIVADGIDHRGEYAWKPDRQVPDRVWLRLDVTDAAGNTATSTTDQPVNLTGLVPRGRIIDVQPVRAP